MPLPLTLMCVLPRSFPGSLALNAAIFASVMLASRLSSQMDVFAFLAFAMQWFALFPVFRQRLKVVCRPTGALGRRPGTLIRAAGCRGGGGVCVRACVCVWGEGRERRATVRNQTYRFAPSHRQAHSWRAHVWLTVAMTVTTSTLLYWNSTVAFFAYLAAVVFLTFLAPYWLIWVQRYKKYVTRSCAPPHRHGCVKRALAAR